MTYSVLPEFDELLVRPAICRLTILNACLKNMSNSASSIQSMHHIKYVMLFLFDSPSLCLFCIEDAHRRPLIHLSIDFDSIKAFFSPKFCFRDGFSKRVLSPAKKFVKDFNLTAFPFYLCRSFSRSKFNTSKLKMAQLSTKAAFGDSTNPDRDPKTVMPFD